MKRFSQLKVAFLTAALVGLPNIVAADINITGYGGDSSITSPVFDQANDSSGNPVSFELNQNSDNSSLGTCAMNPASGAASNEAILEEQFPIPEQPTYTSVTNRAAALAGEAPNGDTYVPPRYAPGDDRDDPGQPPQPPPATPEPATLLIMGLGIAGLSPLVRRYRRK